VTQTHNPMSLSKFCITGLFFLCSFTFLTQPPEALANKKEGLPGRRVGAGTRGECTTLASTEKTATKQKKLLMPLIPEDILSKTVSSNPTLYWYVPETNVKRAEFRVVDQQDKPLYTAIVPLSGKAGIVSYKIPTNVASRILRPNQGYEWMFSLLCDRNDPSGNPFVRGILQRVPSQTSLTNQLQNAQPSDRSRIYAQAGIWQEAITEVVQQRCARPNDNALYSQWVQLLRSANLEQYSNEPITGACSAS